MRRRFWATATAIGHAMHGTLKEAALGHPVRDELLRLGDRLRGIETLRANVGAVHDRVTAVEPVRVLELVEAFAGRFVAAVGDPSIGLEKDGGPEEPVRVPPIARAARRAAEAEDALIKPVELRP